MDYAADVTEQQKLELDAFVHREWHPKIGK
jgi:hypothetical protein